MNINSISGVDVIPKGSIENIRNANETGSREPVQKVSEPAKEDNKGASIDIKA